MKTTRSVLVTRPQPGADATVARLAALGHRGIVAPMLEVRQVQANLPDPGAVQAVLVTSANAIPGLPDAYRGRPLLSVGTASAAAARRRGFTRVVSADGDATDLASLARTRCDPDGKPLLLASGQGQGATLATALRQHGFTIQHEAVYAAGAVQSLPQALLTGWAEGTIGSAMFFSAETARAFVRLIAAAGITEGASAIEALAIAPATAAALAPLPWRQVRVAVRPDQDAMLTLLT
jgi:uroporphyrinogen-III synthase